MQPACGRRAAVRFLSFPRAGTALYYMGKNSGNPDLVCQNSVCLFNYILTDKRNATTKSIGMCVYMR